MENDKVIATSSLKCTDEDGIYELMLHSGLKYQLDLRQYGPNVSGREGATRFLVKLLSGQIFDALSIIGLPMRRLREPEKTQ